MPPERFAEDSFDVIEVRSVTEVGSSGWSNDAVEFALSGLLDIGVKDHCKEKRHHHAVGLQVEAVGQSTL